MVDEVGLMDDEGGVEEGREDVGKEEGRDEWPHQSQTRSVQPLSTHEIVDHQDEFLSKEAKDPQRARPCPQRSHRSRRQVGRQSGEL